MFSGNIDVFEFSNFSTPYFIMNPKSLSGITYLANAPFECPAMQLLSGFQFQSLNNRKFRYSYECANLKRELTTDTVSNPWTNYLGWAADFADSNGNINFLDRQNVDCSGKGYLASLEMEVDYEGELLRYNYQYRKPAATRGLDAQCEERKTDPVDAKNYFVPTLQHLHVRCKDNEALKSFWLRVDYNPPEGHAWYEYSCCWF